MASPGEPRCFASHSVDTRYLSFSSVMRDLPWRAQISAMTRGVKPAEKETFAAPERSGPIAFPLSKPKLSARA